MKPIVHYFINTRAQLWEGCKAVKRFRISLPHRLWSHCPLATRLGSHDKLLKLSALCRLPKTASLRQAYTTYRVVKHRNRPAVTLAGLMPPRNDVQYLLLMKHAHRQLQVMSSNQTAAESEPSACKFRPEVSVSRMSWVQHPLHTNSTAVVVLFSRFRSRCHCHHGVYAGDSPTQQTYTYSETA